MAVSSKPYLIRAMYDWIVDSGWVPYLLVDTSHAEVQVPKDYVSPDGRIVLNISPDATRGLHIANDRIVFTTRFSGISHQIFVPPEAVRAIYAKENGRGMMFGPDENDEPPPASSVPPIFSASKPKPLRKKPTLKIVK